MAINSVVGNLQQVKPNEYPCLMEHVQAEGYIVWFSSPNCGIAVSSPTGGGLSGIAHECYDPKYWKKTNKSVTLSNE